MWKILIESSPRWLASLLLLVLVTFTVLAGYRIFVEGYEIRWSPTIGFISPDVASGRGEPARDAQAEDATTRSYRLKWLPWKKRLLDESRTYRLTLYERFKCELGEAKASFTIGPTTGRSAHYYPMEQQLGEAGDYRTVLTFTAVVWETGRSKSFRVFSRTNRKLELDCGEEGSRYGRLIPLENVTLEFLAVVPE